MGSSNLGIFFCCFGCNKYYSPPLFYKEDDSYRTNDKDLAFFKRIDSLHFSMLILYYEYELDKDKEKALGDNSIVIPVKNSGLNPKEKTNFESNNNNIISLNDEFEDMSMIGYKKDAFDVTKPIIIKNGFGYVTLSIGIIVIL